MDMKDHILAALKEELDRWEELLSTLSDEQIMAPLLPSTWSIKDVIAHVMAWQQRSNARVEAALLDREPQFPVWSAGVDPDEEGATEQINAWLYDTYQAQPWSQVHQAWRAGFLRFLETAEQIAEPDLLGTGRYPWLPGHPLAFILVASYDHHQEHYEKTVAWLQEHGTLPGVTGGQTL